MKITLMMLLFFVTSCNSAKQATPEAVSVPAQPVYERLNANDFKTKMAEFGAGNYQLVDIRTPSEVANGAIEGAVNLNIYDPTFKTELEKLDRNRPIFLYCASGNRSRTGASEAQKSGFMMIYELDGGFGAWKGAGN
jgi:rhodanese-related sulfurtransferase